MPKRLYGKLEGPVDWNGAIYDKLSGKAGVYFINVRKKGWFLNYPLGISNIIYIGQSQDISNRLLQHEKNEGKSWAGKIQRQSPHQHLFQTYKFMFRP